MFVVNVYNVYTSGYIMPLHDLNPLERNVTPFLDIYVVSIIKWWGSLPTFLEKRVGNDDYLGGFPTRFMYINNINIQIMYN